MGIGSSGWLDLVYRYSFGTLVSLLFGAPLSANPPTRRAVNAKSFGFGIYRPRHYWHVPVCPGHLLDTVLKAVARIERDMTAAQQPTTAGIT
jgi:hypothetical protein